MKMPGSSAIPFSDVPLPVPAVAEKQPAKPRRFYIRGPIIERYGYTPGCRGCEAVLAGDPTAVSRNHAEKCRKRMTKAMEKGEFGKRRREDAQARMEEAESKSAKVDDEGERRRNLKRASDVNVRDLDAERNQRDDEAQSSNKRPADSPAEGLDSERRDRLGALLGEAERELLLTSRP